MTAVTVHSTIAVPPPPSRKNVPSSVLLGSMVLLACSMTMLQWEKVVWFGFLPTLVPLAPFLTTTSTPMMDASILVYPAVVVRTTLGLLVAILVMVVRTSHLMVAVRASLLMVVVRTSRQVAAKTTLLPTIATTTLPLVLALVPAVAATTSRTVVGVTAIGSQPSHPSLDLLFTLTRNERRWCTILATVDD